MTAAVAPFAALLAVGLTWGITTPMVKAALEGGFTPLGALTWQIAVSLPVLTVILALRGRLCLPLAPADLRLYAVVAAMGMVVPHFFSYTALGHLPSGVISIIVSMVPIFALPIALIVGTERFRPVRALGLALGAAAILLLVAPDASLPPGASAGFVAVAALTPLCYAIEGAYVAGRGSRTAGPMQTLLGATAIAVVVVVPLAVVTGQAVSPLRPWGSAEVALTGAGILATGAYAGYVGLIRATGAVFAAQVSYVVTGSGVVWAMILLGESYSGWVWGALALLFAGLFLVQPLPRAAVAVAVRGAQARRPPV